MASSKTDGAISSATEPDELSQEDRELIFRQATSSLVHWYVDQFADGMTDQELSEALTQALGIFGGSGGPDRPSVTFKGAGLKIWGGWTVINHVTTPPLFSGATTTAMAREVYGIADPSDTQLNLL